jgi:spore germination protein KC
MRKLIQMLFVTILMTIILTGCWSSKELTDLAIATALGIDYEDGQFIVTAQVINPDEIAGKTLTSRTAVSTYTAKGHTIFEAIRKLTTVAPRKIYLAHLRIIIFGEEYAKEGIAESLDFISRDHQMRTDFLFAIAKGHKAQDLIKVLTPLEKIPANKLFSSLEASQESWAPTKVVRLDELIASMTSKGKEAILTGLYVIGDVETGTKLQNVEQIASPTRIETDFLGVFKNDQLIGWLNESQSKGFNYITNNVKNTVGWVECGNGGKLTLEIMKSDTKLEGRMKGDTPKIKIQTTIEANIGDVACVIDFTDPNVVKEIEQKLVERTENIFRDSVEAAKAFKADIFGFGEIISRADHKKWKELESNWSDIFAEKLEIEPKVEVKIRRTGTITQPFLKMIEEKKKESEQ